MRRAGRSDFSFAVAVNCAISGSLESKGSDVVLVLDSTLSGGIKAENNDEMEITGNSVAGEIFVSGAGTCIVDGNQAQSFNTSGCTGTNP